MTNILKDIDRVKHMKEETEDGLPIEEKTARDIKFTTIRIGGVLRTAWKDDEGLWYYIQDEKDIYAYADTEAMITKIGVNTELILGYADMPYEKLIDKDEKEYLVTLYVDTFLALPPTVTTLTIDNWSNRNITHMSFMFAGSVTLKSVSLGKNFYTPKLIKTHVMFYNCSALETISLGVNFNTTNVANMGEMFEGCSALNSIALFKTSSDIIKELPSATWTVKDNASKDLGSIVIVQGTSATWSPADLLDKWEDNAPWTLSRTIQG